MTPDENKKKKQEIVCSRWGQCEFLSHAGFIADGMGTEEFGREGKSWRMSLLF